MQLEFEKRKTDMSERTNRKQKKSGKTGGIKLQSRMSRKVLIPVICLVIIAILSSVIGHRNLKSMYQASNEITSVYMTKTAQLNEISDKFKEMEILAYSMCVTKSTNDRASMLEQSAATKEEINSLLEQLDQMAVTEDEKSRVKNITAYYQGFTDAYQKVTDSIENGNKTQAQEYCNLELFKAANKLSDELASYIEFYNADVDRVVANQSTVYDSGNYANLIVIGLIVVSLIASLYITIFKVVRPIRKTSKELKVIVKDMQSGHADLTKRVTVKGNDEIAELASGMNVFLDTLQEVLGKIATNSNAIGDVVQNVGRSVETHFCQPIFTCRYNHFICNILYACFLDECGIRRIPISIKKPRSKQACSGLFYTYLMLLIANAQLLNDGSYTAGTNGSTTLTVSE